MCVLCGNPACYYEGACVSQEPYCDTCAEDAVCATKMDAQCVIYHFKNNKPTRLINLGIPNNTNLEVILEKIDELIGDNFNIPFQPQDTITIKWTPGGAAGHQPQADLEISESTGNILTTKSDGAYVSNPNPNYFVKVDQNDVPDFLGNQIVGGTDGIVSISTEVEDGLVKIKPTINLLCLINKIRTEHQAEFCELVDSCKCLLTIENLIANIAAACPSGYTLDGDVCVAEETTAPTTGVTEVEACANFYEQYGQYGAIVYESGFTPQGTGNGANLAADISNSDVIQIVTPQVWMNNDHSVPGTSDGDNHGPVNRAGVWDCAGVGVGSLGFSVPVNVPATKTYYVAIAADDKFQLSVNGAVIIDNTALNPTSTYYLDGGAIFRFWHIYPITLTAGVNYIGLIGVDTGGVQSVIAAEIYDNTLAELQAAALHPDFVSDPSTFPLDENHYSNLDLVFSTRCARQPGSIFSIGVASCPDSSWSLDTTGGDPLVAPCQGINSDIADWVCRKTITAPFSGYTVTLVWDRIPSAVSYSVQQKLHSDPDSAYVDSVGSPVDDPGTGSTATLVVSGLASDEMDFRVRANFEDCSTEWTVVSSDAVCVPVSIDDSVVLPDGVVGSPYSASIPITGGTPPYIISSFTGPAWASIALGLTEVTITGTPDVADEDVEIGFEITNCTSGETAVYSDTIDVTETPTNPNPIEGTLSLRCVNPSGGDGGCASQSHIQLEFNLNAPLTSPVTMKIGAIELYVNGTVRGKYGQTLIPGVPSGFNVWGDGTPATVTIPAGVTNYITRDPMNFNTSTFKFGASANLPLTCFNTCNGSYNANNYVAELYIQLQAPNDGLTLGLTVTPNVDTNPAMTITQIP